MGLQGRSCVLETFLFITRPIRTSIVKEEPMTVTQIVKKTRIKMFRGLLCLFTIETMCKWLRLTQKSKQLLNLQVLILN